MPAFPIGQENLNDLVAFLLSLGSELRHSEEAPGLFLQYCSACHRLAGQGGMFGSDLTDVGKVRSVAYMQEYAQDPKSLNPDALMPPMVDLTRPQMEDIARYVAVTALTETSAVEDSL